MPHSTGLELLLDLRGCNAQVLDNLVALEEILVAAAGTAGFEVVSHIAHQFTHQGVTLVLILSQSHLALHTWPEERFAAADIYVCGEMSTVSAALDVIRRKLIEQFDAESSSQHIIERSGDDRGYVGSYLDRDEEQV